MKFFITGIGGQLGHDIELELRKRNYTNILAPHLNELDITDESKVKKVIKEYKPDVIFHCAAWTAVDKAEEMADDCYKVNVIGTKNIADASIEVGSKLLYMSTDYVFDGQKDGLYEVNDKVNPLSIYGKTKYEGEEEVRRNPQHYITRISWVFGINGNNFIKTMLKLSDTHDTLTVVSDQIGSPTYTRDLAKLLVDMSLTDKYGTYHATNEEYCSWSEFADYIFRSNNINTKVIPVTTEEYYKGKDMSKIATRPMNSKLDKSKLDENGFDRLPSWKDATDRYCNELVKAKILIRK
ncbi:MAG: dTDP-4-dehydrorhamnose reductase [Bacilli bacterium]|nr:dTDP-4-dehydrorhamnose reductase [Bacilli bacterium]